MPYNIHFISLGCAKNVVNCEQMMELCRQAGHTLREDPAGCDVVVVNTCGFLTSANEEAIEHILRMAELKQEGKLKKILVTGCMTQRYQTDVTEELPEVDGILAPAATRTLWMRWRRSWPAARSAALTTSTPRWTSSAGC